MAGPTLKGKRILVLEDDFLIAMLIEEALLDEGCEIIGPVDNVTRALALAETAFLGGAVLDVNVAGVIAFPVAEALEARNVPFIFVSGYGASAVGERNWKVCAKPFRAEELVSLLMQQIGLA